MADKLSKERRSWNMQQIRSQDTKPEIIVRHILFMSGYRYRIHVKNLPGTPDIVLPKYKKVIFVNGCFWHQHPGCKFAVIPKTNQSYWVEKLKKNVERDHEAKSLLETQGWQVLVVWGCQMDDREALSKQIRAFLSA